MHKYALSCAKESVKVPILWFLYLLHRGFFCACSKLFAKLQIRASPVGNQCLGQSKLTERRLKDVKKQQKQNSTMMICVVVVFLNYEPLKKAQ